MNLYQKLVELQKCAASFEKDSKGYGYTYVSGAQVLNAIKKKKDELGLLLIPAVQNPQEVSKHEYKNEKGREKVDFVVRGEMVYQWVNAEKPEESLVVPWQYFGQQDDISKAFGSALTYSERYFLLKFLGIPTDEDDPDAYKEPITKKSAERSYDAPKTYDTPKVSKWNALKELAAKGGVTMNDAVAITKRLFNIEKINDLTDEQYAQVVAEMKNPTKGLEKIDTNDLPF